MLKIAVKRKKDANSICKLGAGWNSLSQSLTALTAPSGREPLAWRQSFRLKCKAACRAYPFRLLPLVAATFPKGTANPLSHRCAMPAPPKGELFCGGGKVAGIAQRRPLGGAGERSEPEGVSSPQTSSPSQALTRQLSQRESPWHNGEVSG